MLRLEAGDALLAVDLQNDFCPGGALAVPGGDSIVEPINRLAGAFGHVLMTQDWHPADHGSFASQHPGAAPFESVELPYGRQTLWPNHCVQGTWGADFHEAVHLPQAELVLRKGFRRDIDSYSAFMENDRRTPTGLVAYLRERGLGRLFLVGLATDFCVHYSALDGRAAGFEVVVLEDLCRAIDLEGSLAQARRAMQDAGVHLATSGDLA
jgi:nicotinamidase/pyrazinamidase